MMRLFDDPRALRAAQATLLALFIAVNLPSLETFPNGVDQSEYVWMVEAHYLPHSPYIVFLGAGLLFGSVLGGALGLAVLSFVSAVLALVLLTGSASRLLADGDPTPRDEWAATLGVAVIGASFLFAKHAVTQEVYMFQTCLVLAALRAASGRVDTRALVLSGTFTGLALGTHTGTLMVLPALAVLALWRPEGSRLRAIAVWAGCVGLTVAAWVGVIALLLPAESQPLADYLRGITKHHNRPGLESADALAKSASELWVRMTDTTIAVGRGAHARGPLGLSAITLVTAAAGLIASWRSQRRLAAVATL